MSTAAQSLRQQKPGVYEVPRAAGNCSVSGEPIAPGDKYIAALRETPEGLERMDISLPRWEGFDRAGLLGFWQTMMRQGEEKKKVFVDDGVLCQLFERLGEATEPNKINFRFVLGLILMRKRLIVYEGNRHETDREIWVVRMKGQDKKLDLVDPRLDEQQVAEVSQQLGQILNEEL